MIMKIKLIEGKVIIEINVQYVSKMPTVEKTTWNKLSFELKRIKKQAN